jgi:hypothetical protein
VASTVTIQSVLNFCRTHGDLVPLADVGGFTNEPGLSLANDSLQFLCAQPNAWKFNRVASNILVTQSARQEYQFAGASAFTSQYGASIGLASNTAISESGNTVTVTTLQPHNFSVGNTVYMTGNTVAAYNSTYSEGPTSSGWSGGWVITAVPSTTSFQFTHASSGLGTSGAAGITDFAWLESAEMYDTRATEPNPRHWELEAVRTMKRVSGVGRPSKIAVISESGGILTVRIEPVGNEVVWGITLNYQAKPPLKTALSDTWAPFPDEFAFVYRQAFLARAYRYLDHRRADAEEARALATIGKAMARDDNETENQYVVPAFSLMD